MNGAFEADRRAPICFTLVLFGLATGDFMATETDISAMNLYSAIMGELKARVRSIHTLVAHHAWVPAMFIHEYARLQLRMSCELIALGCLVAHGDITETKSKKMQKAYSASEIMGQLEALHPSFFPVPVKPEFSPGHVHLADYDQPFLTKSEMLDLYGRSGDYLHRGNIKGLLDPATKPPINFDEVMGYGQKIFNLLSAHRIIRIGGRFMFVTILEDLSRGGQVTVAIGEAPPEQSVEANR